MPRRRARRARGALAAFALVPLSVAARHRSSPAPPAGTGRAALELRGVDPRGHPLPDRRRPRRRRPHRRDGGRYRRGAARDRCRRPESAWQDLDVVIDRRLVAAGVWIVVFCLLALLSPSPSPSGRPRPARRWVALAAVVVALSLVHRRLLHAAHRWLFGGTDDPMTWSATSANGWTRRSIPPRPSAIACRPRPGTPPAVCRTRPHRRRHRRCGWGVRSSPGRARRVPLVAGGATLGRIEVSPRGHGQRRRRSRPNSSRPSRHAARVAEAHPARPGRQRCPPNSSSSRGRRNASGCCDLHDGLGPLLAGARMQLAAAGQAPTTDGGPPWSRGRRRSRDGDAVGAELVEGPAARPRWTTVSSPLSGRRSPASPDCATTVEVRGDLQHCPRRWRSRHTGSRRGRDQCGAARPGRHPVCGPPDRGADLLTVTDDGEAAGDSAPGQPGQHAGAPRNSAARSTSRPEQAGRPCVRCCRSPPGHPGTLSPGSRRRTGEAQHVTASRSRPSDARRRRPSRGASRAGRPVVGEEWAGEIREVATVGDALSSIHSAPPAIARRPAVARRRRGRR